MYSQQFDAAAVEMRVLRQQLTSGQFAGATASAQRVLTLLASNHSRPEAGTSKSKYEGWIAADPFHGGVRVVITGPEGFERAVLFAFDEDPAVITERVRETIDE
jgi:hypothetical protein